MPTAHYYSSKKEKFLIIGVNGRHTTESLRLHVSGKREALNMAKQLGAKPWNF